MFKLYRHYISYVLLFAVLFAFPFSSVAQEDSRSQDVVAVNKAIRFRHGAISTVVNNRIMLGTTHWYRVRALRGQQLAVVLKTGNKTSFTVYGNKTGILEGADAVRQAVVELPETGEFLIEIGTDANANYTLKVTIK